MISTAAGAPAGLLRVAPLDTGLSKLYSMVSKTPTDRREMLKDIGSGTLGLYCHLASYRGSKADFVSKMPLAPPEDEMHASLPFHIPFLVSILGKCR